MYVFIDESGIHKKIDHSVFVLVYIEVKLCPEIEARICNLEKRL